MTDSYPLAWPVGWKRTSSRTYAKFQVGKPGVNARKLTIRDGQKRVMAELGRMGVREDDVIISTNVKPHIQDSQGSNVSDPGVAVYWHSRGKPQRVLSVDRYNTVADNLAALAATLEAMRAIERHGGAVVMDRAFEGFTALPPPTRERDWWDVLEVRRDASIDAIKAAHRRLLQDHHPDRGGSHERMAEINRARDNAMRERAIA